MSIQRATAIAVVVGLVAPLAIVCMAPQARAQQSHPKFPDTDGYVRSLAIDGDRLYVSGDFRLIGTPNGGAAVTDTSSGECATGFPEVHGDVYAAVDDGDGGWYVGGAFDRVGGLPRSNLAHVRGDLSVAPWAPRADRAVRAMQRSGGTVYVGGDFLAIDGVTRSRLAALDIVSGALRSWDVPCDGVVRAMALFDGNLYLGGDFTSVDGQVRLRLAGVDAATGALAPWAPSADGSVRCVAIDEHTLYAGGDFMSVSGVWRHRLAAIRLDDQSVTPWNGTADGPVYSLAVSGGRIFVGGAFGNVGGKARTCIAALSKRWWQALEWYPEPNPPAGGTKGYDLPRVDYVTVLAVAGNRVYVGGRFTSIGGADRFRLAAFDTATGVPLEWKPSVNGTVRCVAPSRGRVFVGGEWTSSACERRDGLVAIDRRTERVLPWNPTPDSHGLVAARGGRVFVTGYGQLRALDGGDARELWKRPMPTHTAALLAGDSLLYAGAYEDGSPGGSLLAFDVRSGVERWSHAMGRPSSLYEVDALAIADGLLYAGGAFQYVDRVTISIGIAAFDAVTGAWEWGPDDWHSPWRYGLVTDGSSVIASASTFDRIDARANTIAGLCAAPLTRPALAVMQGRLYAGGRESDGPPASVLSIDLASGQRTSWQPDIAANYVSGLVAADGVVYLGGGLSFVNGERRAFLAAIDDTTSFAPLAAPTPAASLRLAAPMPNPFTSRTDLVVDLPRAQQATLDVLDIAGRRVATIATGRFTAGRHEFALRGERLAAGIYWARLATDDGVYARRIVRLP